MEASGHRNGIVLRDEGSWIIDVWDTITGRRYGDSSDDLGSVLIQDIRLGQEAAHADPRPGVESVFGFLPTNSQQARRELIG